MGDKMFLLLRCTFSHLTFLKPGCFNQCTCGTVVFDSVSLSHQLHLNGVHHGRNQWSLTFQQLRSQEGLQGLTALKQ
jgi:hypothetical protein